MAWGKVDDKLHASVKWRRASKGGRALWTTALSWCSDQENGGQVPSDMLRVLDGTPSDAKSLVSAGLWDTTGDGWEFHDWADYNPDSASAKAVREAKSDGGKQGNHARWHVKRKVRVPGCEFCESDPESDNRLDSDRTSESGPNPPVPTRPDPTPKTPSESKPRSRATSLPKNWTPTQEHIERAAQDGLDLNRELVKFRAHAEEKGRTAKSWNGAFTRWLIQAAEYAQARPGNVTPFGRPKRDVGVDQWLA